MKNQVCDETKFWVKLWASVAVVFVLLIIVYIGTKPIYKAWAMEKAGEGALRSANLERQALVAQAQAERDAAELRAKAIEIIGEASQMYPEYRQQEFIGAFARCMETGCANQIIYVPTESGIPIIESSRLQRR